MDFWELLGIEPTKDKITIKKAFASQVKLHKPSDDAELYQKIREAYNKALEFADSDEEIEVFEEDEVEENETEETEIFTEDESEEDENKIDSESKLDEFEKAFSSKDSKEQNKNFENSTFEENSFSFEDKVPFFEVFELEKSETQKEHEKAQEKERKKQEKQQNTSSGLSWSSLRTICLIIWIIVAIIKCSSRM